MITNEKALLYHTHHSRHNEDVAFWLYLAAQQLGPVLELACGTGRVLIPLAEAGFGITGVDHDPGMLAYLSSILPPRSQGRVTLLTANLVDFGIERKFALIFIACNTLNTLPEHDRVEVLRRVSHHLLPGGLFAASVPNFALLDDALDYGELEVEETFTHPVSGFPVQVSSEYEKQGDWLALRWHYDHLRPEGLVERHTIETRHALIGYKVYAGELARADLELTGCYGDYDRSAYLPDSPQLILMAKKPPVNR
jgi:SAM-dependent methyltransferase